MTAGYTRPTGHPFRWPDVLDVWAYWEHTDPARKLPALLAPAPGRGGGKPPCEYFDADLRDVIYHAVADVNIDSRSAEDDCAIANIIDAAVAEQARRIGVLDDDYFARTVTPQQLYSLSPYYGKCDRRFDDMKVYLNGLIKRPVV